jgi:hypothetical protein
MQRQQILEAMEHLKGGMGDGKQDVEFDPEELAMGVEIEKEHTNSALIAKEIAKDHLSEIPDYYSRLKNMEKQADVPSEEPKPEDVQEEAKDSDKKEWRLHATSPTLDGVLNMIKTRMWQPKAELVPESDGVWKVKNDLSNFGLPFLPHWRVIKKKDRYRVELRNYTPEESSAIEDAKKKWQAHESEHKFGFKDGKPIQKESASEGKPLHKKQHINDINVVVVMMPDDEYSKDKQEASDIVFRKEAIELCSMDANEVYGVFSHDEWDEAMKIAKGLIEEVNQARAERASEDNE